MTRHDIIEYLDSLCPEAIHGKNIRVKLNHRGAPQGFKNDDRANLFFRRYKTFRESVLLKMRNPKHHIRAIVNALNKYKTFVNLNNPFTSQSKYESTILEEFIFYLLNGIAKQESIKYGPVNAYCNLYFSPKNLKSFIDSPSIGISTKNQDFAIYRKLMLSAESSANAIDIPIVSVECKTYLDKTMLDGSIATAEKVKMGNPHSKYFIVTETYQVDYDVDISYSRIDQIFVLRKQKSDGSGKKPISPDVVLKLYKSVESHLRSNWIDVKKNIERKGVVRLG